MNYRRKIIKLSKQISKKKDQRLAKEHWKILEKITNLSESVFFLERTQKFNG